MNALFTLTLALLLFGAPPEVKSPRQPHPLAPSLPQLTDEEEEELDRIIDRFIQADIGLLRGTEAQKARADFEKLGPEATFALIRGLNRAAKIEHSCPAVLIAKKLGRILGSTTDVELLDFARENIGLGVGRSRHEGVLRELRLACSLRRGRIAASAGGGAAVGPKPPRAMTVTELAEAAGSERGQRLKEVLIELEQRRGDEVIAALGTAAASYEGDIRQLARDLLTRHLARQPAAVLKEKLKDDRAEVRRAAALIIGVREPRLAGDLIELLADSEESVRAAAHQALVRLSRGVDFGPRPNAGTAEQEAAIKKWREWWARQAGR
ncbi:MAG TPA: hypothetical protein VNK04_09050 [Gemmataceae bacterium]|nr:hypothetical protein [Gemmataceae bacterium]